MINYSYNNDTYDINRWYLQNPNPKSFQLLNGIRSLITLIQGGLVNTTTIFSLRHSEHLPSALLLVSHVANLSQVSN